ncbi:hypothetical protein LguiA_004753 [Lonicera macranthoides]
MSSEVRNERFPMTGVTVPARPLPERFKAVTDWLFKSQETPIHVHIEALEVADQVFDKMPERSIISVLIARSVNLSSMDKQELKQISNNNETAKMKEFIAMLERLIWE